MTINVPLTNVLYPTHRQRDLGIKLVLLAHSACDSGNIETALELLRAVDLLVERKGNTKTSVRRLVEHTVVAHERVWSLRNSRKS